MKLTGDRAGKSRFTRNGIGVVGLVLVLAMALGALVSPGGADAASVDSFTLTDCSDGPILIGEALMPSRSSFFDADPCCSSPVSHVAQAGAFMTCQDHEPEPEMPAPELTPEPEPTEPPPVVEPAVELPEPPAVEPVQEEEGERAPVRDARPRQQVRGPTWLGPINPDIGGAAVTLEFPDLLSVFIGPKAIVHVFDDDGTKVFEGRLSKSNDVSFLWPGSDYYTVKAELLTTTDYTEVVPTN